MKHVPLDLDQHFNELIDKWVDSLEANHDDYVHVDGEEGDFGIVRYFGFDVDGNANVHMMTRYIQGGDVEDVLYTLAGGDMVQKILRQNFESVIRNRIEANLDPGYSSDGMYPGFVAAFEKSTKILDNVNMEIEATLGVDPNVFVPHNVEHGKVYLWKHRLFKAFVTKPRNPDHPAKVGFRNIADPSQYITYLLEQNQGVRKQECATLLSVKDWNSVGRKGRIALVELWQNCLPENPKHFPALKADIKQIIYKA